MRRAADGRALRWAAAALTLVAYALRVWSLGEQNVWWDEALAVWAVRKGLAETTLWTAGDVHPPLFFWLLWGWMRLVGQTEFALRYLVAGTGVATAVLGFACARRAGGRGAALLALALLGLSRFEVWWSMELRMYMPAGALLAAALYCAQRWLATVCAGSVASGDEGSGSGRYGVAELRWLGGAVVAGAAALHTLYLAAAGIAALAAGVLGVLALGVRRVPPRRRRAAALRYVAAQAVLVGFLVPWLALALPRMQSWSSGAGAPPSPGFVAQLWATLLATGRSTDLAAARGPTLTFVLAAGVLPLLAVAAGGRRARKAGLWAGLLLGPMAFLPPIAVWLATQPRSWFYSPSVEARYLAPFAAPAYVLAALALVAAGRRSRPLAALLAAAALLPMAVSLPGHYADRRLRDDMQSMVLAIWSQAEPDDTVLLTSGDRYPLFLYYYEQPWTFERAGSPYEWTAAPGRPVTTRPPVLPFPDRAATPIEGTDWQPRLERIASGGGRIWLVEVEAHLRDPEGRVRAWLQERMHLSASESHAAHALHLFTHDGRPPTVTAVSGRWPGVRRPRADLPAAYHPIVGLPVARLGDSDQLDVTLWRKAVGAAADDDGAAADDPYRATIGAEVAANGPLLGVGWLVEPVTVEKVRAETAAPAEGVVPPRADRPGGGEPGLEGAAPGMRTRFPLRIDERTPGGRMSATVQLVEDVASIARLEVVGGLPPLRPGASVLPCPFPLPLTDASVWLQGFADWQGPPGWASTLHISGAAVTSPVAAGRSLVVDLRWRRAETAPGTATRFAGTEPVVFVHLVGPPRPDGSGTVWAGHDGPPSSGSWTGRFGRSVFDRHVLRVDPQAPAGDYELEIGLYDPGTGRRLQVRPRSPAGAGEGWRVDEAERRLLLAPIAVTR